MCSLNRLNKQKNNGMPKSKSGEFVTIALKENYKSGVYIGNQFSTFLHESTYLWNMEEIFFNLLFLPLNLMSNNFHIPF